jgi:hypothetical protein
MGEGNEQDEMNDKIDAFTIIWVASYITPPPSSTLEKRQQSETDPRKMDS